MANIVISDEGYGFNYEWIAAGSGIGEEICGVDKDCIVVPSSPLLAKIEPVDPPEESTEYVEIQGTEEEVITDQWSSQNHGSEDDGLSFRVDSSHEEDVIVPLPEEQDEYSRLHPYPCDFCSRRFSKKSALTAHMITHQVERPHGCNMCGAQYRRKLDLVEHMKIHAYAPVKEEPEDDYMEYPTLPEVKAKQRARRKKKNLRKYDFNEPVIKVKKRKTSTIIDNGFVDIKVEPDTDPLSLHSNDIVPKFPVCDPNKPYVCQHCGVGFAREKALSSHTMVHVGDTDFDCELCGEMFQSEKLLQQHNILRHSSERYKHQNTTIKKEEDSYGSFLCNVCGLSFQWYNQLKKHRKTHIKQETIPVDEDGHLCTLCNVVFNSLEELLYHKQDHDSEMGVHTCYLCGEGYESLVDLKDHMRMKHKTSHMCEICDKMFKDGKALSKHLSSHIEVRTFPCNICSRRFHSKAKLKKHMVMHDENKSSASGMLCRDCGEVFDDGQSLLNHRQSAHGVNISRMFPCLQCGKAFNSRSSHQIHLRIHTGERPYGCRYCWKAFGDGGTLRKHERIHTGEKPYVCPVCSKAFNQRVVLREHIRAHHSGTESRLNDNCYECMVCGFILKSSSELCAHLVLHSDENTAKHRTPKSSRKYVRKKNRFSSAGLEEEDESGGEEESRMHVSQPPPAPPIPKPQHIVRFSDDLETAIKIDPDLNTSTMDLKGRARIVRSGRKGVPRGQNKRYMKGKTKASRLMSNTSYASKYIVSRPEDSDPLAMSPERSTVNGVSGGLQRSRPRTKNVSYHNTKPAAYELATFPLEADPPQPSRSGKSSGGGSPRKRGRKPAADTSSILAEPGENQYVNGIDLFEEGAAGEQIETCIVDDIDVELKLEVKTSESDECYISPEDMSIKMEYVSCDMCSEVFTSRSDLLKHIQIHI